MKKLITAAILSLSMFTACADTDTAEVPETSAEVTTASQAETEKTAEETASENADHIIIKGVEYSTSLTELNLVELKLTDEDIKDLNKMTALTRLDLCRNYQISDISPLKNLTNLTYLDLGNNQISDADIEELKRALPDCEIKY